MKYYILDSRSAVGNCALWWRPDSAGYTTELGEAGLYERCPSDRDTDILVPKEIAERLAVRHVRLDRLRAEFFGASRPAASELGIERSEPQQEAL
jgi:hypothetical protein